MDPRHDLTPVTYDDADNHFGSVTIRLYRGPSPKSAPIFEEVGYNESYTDLAVMEKAFAPWTYTVDGGSDQLIHIPPSGAAEAIARFEDLCKISPDTTPEPHVFNKIRDTLLAATEREATVIIASD